jgi:hypothetical protein
MWSWIVLTCAAGVAPTPQPERAPPPPAENAFHRAHAELPPAEAFAHVRAAHQAARRARAAGKPFAPSRPAGAGRYVAAVLLDATADAVAHELLGLARPDALVLSAPAAIARAEDIALLERVAAEEKLSLCVVLVARASSLWTAAAGGDPSAAAAALARRLEPARERAQRTGEELAAAHAALQAEVVTSASEILRRLHRAGKFAVAAGVLAAADEIVWCAPWYERPLPAEVHREAAPRGPAPAPPPAEQHSAAARPPRPGPAIPYVAPRERPPR